MDAVLLLLSIFVGVVSLGLFFAQGDYVDRQGRGLALTAVEYRRYGRGVTPGALSDLGLVATP